MSRVRSLLRRDAQGESAPPAWVPYALAAGGVVLLLALVLVGLRLARPGVLPGVALDGRDLGGSDRAELTAAVTAYDEARGEETVSVALDSDRVDAEHTSPREALGFDVDVDETVARIWGRGRQLNPVAALSDHLRAFGDGIDVAPAVDVDEEVLDEWVQGAADALDRAPDEGSLEITGTSVELSEPAPGVVTDREALAELAHEHVTEPGPQRLEVPAEVLAPDTDPEALAALVDDAETAVSGPVRLFREEAALELSGEQVGDLLEVGGTAGERRLEVDADALAAHVDDELRAALETDPVDAEIALGDGGVVIDESVEGFRFEPEAAAAQLVEVATSEPSDGQAPREAELDGETIEPARTTAEAEALEIVEEVASFTTNHACCQSRVQNIQRMADLVDGVVLEPGEEFSINDYVGPRTREKGFTDGGVIVQGEFETAVGGGVSQFATTFFNAAFFGGYEILDHQPHSYYISRYPVGRESTLNYPDIDVRIRNDSPYGVLIDTSYTGTSITVSFWGKEWVDVDSTTSGRANVRPPPTSYREDSSLAPGAERVVQSGRQGFTVTYTRTLDYHDGGTEEQSWTHTYRPEPRIIARNTSDPPDSGDDADQEPPDDGQDPDEDDDGEPPADENGDG